MQYGMQSVVANAIDRLAGSAENYVAATADDRLVAVIVLIGAALVQRVNGSIGVVASHGGGRRGELRILLVIALADRPFIEGPDLASAGLARTGVLETRNV